MKSQSFPRIVCVCFVSLTLCPDSTLANCAPIPSQLAAWWRGEDNALDSSGNNRHGISQNGVTYSTGVVGQAFRFNGTNALVDLGGNSPFRQSHAITYAFWARLPSGGGGDAMGVGAANGQGFGGIFLSETNFWFLWTPSNPLADAAVRSLGITFPSNQWLHFAVAMNYTNRVPAMYVNGQPVSTVVSNFIAQPLVTWVPSGQYNAGLSDSIGGRFINTPFFFNGELDEVDVYSRALNSAEIAALFAAGSAGKCNGPRLQIDKLPGAVRLSWTTNASGYRLETNSALTLPAGWGVLASNYSVIATNYAVTNAVGAGSRFYRLFKP